MATSKLELAVGTGQWDAGLKKAQQALNSFTQAQGGLQQALAKDNGDMQKFIQMMGKIDSTSNTAKGQMNDYKRVLEQLTTQYNQMSDAQKKSIGQDYLQTIDALKQKFSQAKQQVEDFNKSLGEAGKIKMPETGGGLFGGGKLDGMLQVFGGNLMTKGASILAEFGAEMGDMVKQGIELAKQGEGIRIAFERLGRGDILQGLREATHGTVTDIELMKAAVKFNDFKLPLEELGTMLAFAQQKAKDTGQSVDYMVDSIVTGLGRKSLMILDNLGLSAAEIKEKMAETGDMTKAVGAIIREQMQQAGDYVETAADRAAQANVNLQNKMEELGRKFAPLEEASNQLWTSMKIGILDVIDGPLLSLLNYLNQASRSAEDLLTGSLTEVGSNVDDKGNYIKRPAQKGAAGFDWEKGTWKPGYSGAIYNAATGQTELPEVSVTGTRREIPKKKPTKGVTKTPKTEEQLNNEQIQKLTQEYIKATDDRRKAIEGEIKTLQDRNKEIARLKDMALGKIGDDGSLLAMTQQLKELQSAQSESASGRDWDDYQKKIDDVTARINVLKGVLPKDQQATFTVDVNAEQLEQLRMLLPVEDETIRINFEEGRVNLPEIPKEDETIRVNITATTADAMKEVRDMVGEIEGWQVAIEPKIEIKEQDLRTPFEKLKDSLKIEIAEENMQVDTTTLQTLMKTAIQNDIDGLDPNFSALQEKMREGMNIPDETWQELQDQINEKLKGLGIEPIKIDFKTGNIANDGKGGGNKSDVDGFKNFNDKFSQLSSGVGSIVSGIQQMGVEIPKELQSTLSVLQGISTIMTGVLAIITLMNAKQTAQTAMSFVPFFAHGGLVHAATGYMVPGNDHADRTLIAASSGELILNRAQQGVIASQLENGNGGGMRVVGEIQGEKIVLVANRFLKRSGQGELVTWK